MDGKVVIGCELNTRSFEAQIDYVENQMQEIEHKLEQADLGFEVGDTQKLEADYERLGIKLDNLQKKQAKLNQEQANMKEIDLSGVQTGINNVNKGFQGTIKKVAKWGLALFGVRSAYNAIRGAMSTLSQYDTQMADNIEYIKYALASTLQPVIQTILNLVVKLLQYINYIAKAWTGKNLFKTADAFKNAQKNAKGLNKELSKTTASFDEINTVSSQKDINNISTPSIDLTSLQGEVPQWLQWIIDNKDIILAVMSGVAAGLLAWQIGLSGIQSLGIGLAIAGIILFIQSILDYLQDPSWENFGKIITGIGLAVAGVAIIFGAWPIAIAGAITAVVGLIISNWDKIKTLLQNGIDWLKGKGREIFVWLFGEVFAPIYDGFVNNLQLILNFFDKTFNNIKKIFDNIIGFVRNVFTGNWAGAWENIKNIFKTVFDQILNFFNLVFGIIKNSVIAVGKTIGNILAGVFKAVVNGVMGAIENVLNAPIRTINALIGVINKVPGINLRKLYTFRLPRLARGGIINQPGRGIPVGYGQAIAGERGQEGVLPLTDSQQMALLGEAIGKYVRIDNVIDVNMDSRRINRILQSSNNRVALASNR